MGLDPGQLLHHVVRPALKVLDLPGGVLAEKLVMGTAAQESDGFRYIHQLGKGPGLSLWQIEPATARDTLFRCSRPYWGAVHSLAAARPLPKAWPETSGIDTVVEQLHGNLYLGAAMCRLVYYMKPFKWPETGMGTTRPNDAATWCAVTWKRYYNTIKGAGTETQFLRNWNLAKLDDLWEE